jgi:hypothetical protein
VRTWELHDPAYSRPLAAPLERCTELLGVDSAIVQRAAANVEPYIRVDGKVWRLMRLERQLHAEAYGWVPGRLRQPSTAPGPGPPFAPGRRRAPASRPRAQLGALGRCIRGGGAQRRSPDGRAGRLCHCLEGDASAGPIRIGQSGCRRCSFRWDRLPLPAEADQRAGGPVDVPDPLQQPAPAAQRPAVARGPIACSTCARRSAWQRLNARCPR